ncbi:unnamed protein product [Meloidogyne enterolobii]|uniref:Uncharacterized protein n=1 Tax=Meloidogyne enterolobii TaxID=390850 RepID=A0ACB0YN58_MELEN
MYSKIEGCFEGVYQARNVPRPFILRVFLGTRSTSRRIFRAVGPSKKMNSDFVIFFEGVYSARVSWGHK